MQSDQLNYIPNAACPSSWICGRNDFVSGKLGPKRSSENKDKTLNVGLESRNARIPFSVKYFLVAILFVLLM
jgi:NADH-quinone oxidoreductase subunit A